MTVQNAIFDGLPTGMTLSGKAFSEASPDTEVTGNSFAITEGTNAKGRYAVAITRATVMPAGSYDIRLFVGSAPIAVGRFVFAGTDGETAPEAGVELDSAGTAKLNEILAAVEAIDAGGGALTPEQDETLASILVAVSKLRGPAMNWSGNVGPGGVLELTIGDDHETIVGNDLPIRVKDAGGLLYARLIADGTTLQWSAGQDALPALITGTVGTPTHDEETTITTIPVQVPNCSAAGNILAPYKWQLQRTIGGRRVRELKGSLNLNPDLIGA